jgi:hypothetical protein
MSRPLDRRREPLIALGLAAGPVVALGSTRFAYALLLPATRGDLHGRPRRARWRR